MACRLSCQDVCGRASRLHGSGATSCACTSTRGRLEQPFYQAYKAAERQVRRGRLGIKAQRSEGPQVVASRCRPSVGVELTADSSVPLTSLRGSGFVSASLPTVGERVSCHGGRIRGPGRHLSTTLGPVSRPPTRRRQCGPDRHGACRTTSRKTRLRQAVFG